MKTLRILAGVLFFLISSTGNAAITIHATSAAVDRLISANDGTGVSYHPRYSESIGELHQSVLGRVLFGLAAQDNLAFGTGFNMAVDRSLRILGSDNYRIVLDGDSILQRKYAIIFGVLPDGNSALTSEINTRGPDPDEWAIIVLGIGFVIYQMRPRKPSRAANLAVDD